MTAPLHPDRMTLTERLDELGRITHDYIPDAVISIMDAADLAPSLLLPNDICVLDSTT